MEQKELLINSVSMIRVHDNINVPTVLFYPRKGEMLIGSKAFIASRGNRRHLNSDFKIDLGKTDPTFWGANPPSNAKGSARRM